MDNSISDDFWYRDVLFGEQEQEGFYAFIRMLSNYMLPLEANMADHEIWTEVNKDTIIDYWDKYNIFSFVNGQIYQLQKEIKELIHRACNALTINFDDQKYYIHGWIDVYHGELNETDVDNIIWYDSALEENVFNGMLFLDAIDSKNYYSKNNNLFELENIEGRLVVFTNHKWFHGRWNYPKEIDRPKIVLGFNVRPISTLVTDGPIQRGSGYYIPL